MDNREAQQVIQALTFTVVKKKRIPKDSDTINMILDALGLAIRALEELKKWNTLGTYEQVLDAVDRINEKRCSKCRNRKKCAIFDNFNIDYCSDWSMEK